MSDETETEEYLRFIELETKARSSEPHRVSLQEMQEYARLQSRYGVYLVDGIFLGPPNPLNPLERSFRILNTDCKPIPGNQPLLCPRAEPKIPSEMLPGLESRFRELQLVKPGETILWVGSQAKPETLCMYGCGCECFASSTRPGEEPAESLKDETAYRPAKDFLDTDHFPTFGDIRKHLKNHPTIHTRKPAKNRLEIHAGDWLASLRQSVSDPLDLPAGKVDAAVKECEARKAAILAKKDRR